MDEKIRHHRGGFEMTNLKTLKDLKQYMCEDYIKKGLWHRAVTKEEIKAEAIKWVKKMDINKSADYCDGFMDFIMNFFNITEEDLK